MNLPHLFADTPRKTRWFMTVAWIVIGLKCWLVTWAMHRWPMPFHAAWIVAPTLVFAALASGLWLAQREE